MSAVQLRPYQERAAAQALEHLAQGLRPCVVAPTGSGKTVIGSAIAAPYRRPLWLTHTQELVDQARDRVPHCAVRSIQGLLGGDRPEADLVIFDEAHHFVSPVWQQVAADYLDVPFVGLTATPERSDGVALGDLFSSLVVVAQPSELIRDGYLVPVHSFGPSKRSASSWIADPLEAWRQHAAGLRTIVYASSVDHAYDLAGRFRMQGCSAACIEGGQRDAGRAELVAQFRRGDLLVLTNVHLLTEGVDVPEVECVVLAGGTSFWGAYLQKVGRAMRPAPGKTHAIVLDCHGSTKSFAPADSDRTYALTGRAIRRAGDEMVEPVRQCRYCGAIFAAPGRECPRCGRHVPRPETPQERAVRLEHLTQAQAGHDDDRRLAVWRQLQATARERGFKPGWAFYQYKLRYGGPPPRRAA